MLMPTPILKSISKPYILAPGSVGRVDIKAVLRTWRTAPPRRMKIGGTCSFEARMLPDIVPTEEPNVNGNNRTPACSAEVALTVWKR